MHLIKLIYVIKSKKFNFKAYKYMVNDLYFTECFQNKSAYEDKIKIFNFDSKIEKLYQ